MNKVIANLHVRNFRSLEKTSITGCGPLNVLIGKNNAGKSSALAAIPLVFSHLATGRIIASWDTPRPNEQFTHRDTARPLQIGLELVLNSEILERLCTDLTESAPQLTKSIEQLKAETILSFIFRFVYQGRPNYQYIESISVGGLNADMEVLMPGPNRLLLTPENAAAELFRNYRAVESFNQKISAVQKMSAPDAYSSAFFADRKSYGARFVVDRIFSDEPATDPALRRELMTLLETSESPESLKTKSAAVISTATDEIERITKADIATTLTTYSGEARVQPAYVTEICKIYGSKPILSLGERKLPIGRKEAARLLQFKVRRGGPEKLQVVQQTVRSLLGVSLDAFQGEGARDAAEMDVDNFLAEANGAGIREALRMILDLELEPAEIVLIEEPEVHLHPGLEFVVHSYLQEKSKTKQFFLTTHSTNFVDAVSPQHIYLISRDSQGISSCESLAADDASVKIPTELGIRLSTVFMFDRIVFVEGPSDELILREFARKIAIDLNASNVAFVHMGGVANFTHYAAHATLDILSRRRVRMWFIVDRDERNEAEINKMVGRLDGRAVLKVLDRRELENFLIDSVAVRKFILEKTNNEPTTEEYRTALEGASERLRAEVAEIYLEKQLLSPVYLRGKSSNGTISERLASAASDIQSRLASIDTTQDSLRSELTNGWSIERAIKLVPGAMLLDHICRDLGSAFNKQAGDSIKLARHMPISAVPSQLVDILRTIAGHA